MGRRIFNLLAAVSLALFLAWIVFCIWSLPFRQSYWQLGADFILRSDSLTMFLSYRANVQSPFRDIFSISYIHLLFGLAILPAVWATIAISENARKERQIQKSGSSRSRSKCESCGCESPLTAAFVYKEVSFRRARTRCLCPACFKRQHVRTSATTTALILLTCAVVCVVGTHLRNIERSGAQNSAKNFALLYVFIYLLVIPHELGHAAAAWLMRWNVFRITFGIGPRWMEWRIAGIPVQFRLIPDRGSVNASSLQQRNWRLRRFIIIAAGPLVNLAIAIVAIEFAGGWRHFFDDVFASTWSTLGVASGLMFIVNLVPQTVWTHEGMSVSDGLQMARLLFKPLPSERVRRIAYFLANGGALAASENVEESLKVFSAAHIEYPEDASITMGLATILMMTGKVEDGRSLVCGLLQIHKTENAISATLRNNLAWADLLIGSPTLLAEADEMSAAALSLMPWEAYIQSTRGTVLAILGKPDEAMQLLRKSIKVADQRSSRSSIFCAMAIAMHRQGDRKAAEKFIKRARRLYPKCELLGHAKEELSGHLIAPAFATV